MAGRKPNLHTPDRAKAPPQRGLMQLVESWDAYDALSMMRQKGAIPESDQGEEA
jgi:hypothetical protein